MQAEWFNQRPVSIFIDNSIYRNLSYNLTHTSLSTIKKAVTCGDIVLLSTDILKGEFLKHAEILIREDENRLKGVIAARSMLADQIGNLLQSIQNFNSEALWQKFLTDFQPRTIACAVDWQPIFADYFASRPPFGPTKKEEFPDAFNIKLLENHNPSHLIIISADRDFAPWVESRNNTVLFTKLNDFTDSYLSLRDSIFSNTARQALGFLNAKICNSLMERFSDDYHYGVTCSHTEIVGANVDDLEIVDVDLSATNHEEQFAVFSIRAKGHTTLDLNCPVIVWDSVDKEEVHLGSNSRSAKVEIEVKAQVIVFVNEVNLDSSDFELEDEEFFAEDLDVPDSWTSFLDVDEDDFN